MSKAFDPGAAAPADSGIFGLPHSAEEARVIVVPAPFAATTSYGGGAENGPAAILEASRQVDLFDRETGRPYEHGIHMLPIPAEMRAWNSEGRALAQRIIDVGGDVGDDATLAKALARVNELGAKVNDSVYATVRAELGRKKAATTRPRSARSAPTPRRSLASASCTSTRTPISARRTKASPTRTRRSCST
jgi:agmatinase